MITDIIITNIIISLIIGISVGSFLMLFWFILERIIDAKRRKDKGTKKTVMEPIIMDLVIRADTTALDEMKEKILAIKDAYNDVLSIMKELNYLDEIYRQTEKRE